MYFSVVVLKDKSDDEKRGKKQKPSNGYRHYIYKENANREDSSDNIMIRKEREERDKRKRQTKIEKIQRGAK